MHGLVNSVGNCVCEEGWAVALLDKCDQMLCPGSNDKLCNGLGGCHKNSTGGWNCNCSNLAYPDETVGCKLPLSSSPKSDTAAIVGGVVGPVGGILLFTVFSVVVFFAVKKPSRHNSHSPVELSDIAAEELELEVSPKNLTFGSDAVLLPVGVVVKQVITLTASRSMNVSFSLRQSHKYTMVLEDPTQQGMTLSKGRPVKVVLAFTANCTTTINEILTIVTRNGTSFTRIPVHVVSQISTKLDVDDIVLGDPIGAGAYGAVYHSYVSGINFLQKLFPHSASADQ